MVLVSSVVEGKLAWLCAYAILAFTAMLYGFTEAYVWANSARHARTEKIYPITGEKNAQVFWLTNEICT